jgi:hypothetical protein
VLPVLALRWRWRVGVYALVFFALVMIDDRFGNAVYPQVFLGQETLQVLLANWLNTLTMVAAVVGIGVLLWYRRPGSAHDDAIARGERSETQPIAPA